MYKKVMDEDESEIKISFSHTFWIFGLGMGIGAWLNGGTFSDFGINFIVGVVVWFFLVIILSHPIKKIYKWLSKL